MVVLIPLVVVLLRRSGPVPGVPPPQLPGLLRHQHRPPVRPPVRPPNRLDGSAEHGVLFREGLLELVEEDGRLDVRLDLEEDGLQVEMALEVHQVQARAEKTYSTGYFSLNTKTLPLRH